MLWTYVCRSSHISTKICAQESNLSSFMSIYVHRYIQNREMDIDIYGPSPPPGLFLVCNVHDDNKSQQLKQLLQQ